MTKTVASLSRLGSAAALLSLTACGGDVTPVLERATLEHGLGTSSVQMHYEGGVLVGATSLTSKGDTTEWTIEVDDLDRLRAVSGMYIESRRAIDYDESGNATFGHWSGDSEVELDGDRILSWRRVGDERGYVMTYGSNEATVVQPDGDTTRISGSEGCGSARIVHEWVPREVGFECRGNRTTLRRDSSDPVEMLRDDAGRVVQIETGGANAERWTFEWRDDGARSPPLTVSSVLPGGDFVDARGHLSFGPHWLSLPIGTFLVRL